MPVAGISWSRPDIRYFDWDDKPPRCWADAPPLDQGCQQPGVGPLGLCSKHMKEVIPGGEEEEALAD